ncbi:hypothetical protein L3Q82_023455 [Scortum barcoo]|uniref:Uncharacterized protein n=1 Tax=Scortum barcoo TaxID=214431 RepID=A0ACB8WZ02_9TELE|nr:hypothetical protein L3Q82_023455 [Scortum barcoo]
MRFTETQAEPPHPGLTLSRQSGQEYKGERSNDVPGDMELLAVSIRPYYLPREFSHVCHHAITTYIPPSNNKPWVTPDLRALLQEKRKAFQSGDRDELRRVQRDLKRKIKECKASYRRKMEDHLQQNNAREVWRGLQAISGQGKNERRNPEPGDRDWANKLNLFFNRFDTGPTSTPLSLSRDQPTSSSLCLHAPSPPSTPPPSLGLSPSPRLPAFTTISTVLLSSTPSLS